MMLTYWEFRTQTASGLVLLLLLLTGCNGTNQQPKATAPTAPTVIRYNGNSYDLYWHGKPYYIKGAGGVSHLAQLKACGGNSVRVWDDIDAGRILDEAQKLGLTVMLGLWVEREMEGFDYDNQPAVERQYQRIRKTVLKYRNHPALLMWCVGNEWALEADNFKVYDEVNRLSKMVHSLDNNHPVSTAMSSDSERSIRLVTQRCPDIDVLSVNSYALTAQLATFLDKGGWHKPYLISEYGAPGYWETPLAPWKAPDEPNSEQKAKSVRAFYHAYVGSYPPNCFGAYLFYWGTKQEETHTWFSVFDDEGRESPLVGVMQELWSRKKPANSAPVVLALLVDGKPLTNQSLTASKLTHQAHFQVVDPEKDSLTYYWEIKPRANSGTDYVGVPRSPVAGLLTHSNGATVQFRLPAKPGAYRLFANAYDTHNHVATANFSFEVR